MKQIFSAILIFLSIHISAQVDSIRHDTVIKTEIYTSLYSFDYNMPRMVSYKLYKAGGECPRKGMYFKQDSIDLGVGAKDYAKSGYDKGHMAPAKDFAYDCVAEESTFRFYNCVPQSTKNNRGVWKSYEKKIRDLSQTDSILVLCGPVLDSNVVHREGTNLYIPAQTWKIAISLSTMNIIYALTFDNDKVATTRYLPVAYYNEILILFMTSFY